MSTETYLFHRENIILLRTKGPCATVLYVLTYPERSSRQQLLVCMACVQSKAFKYYLTEFNTHIFLTDSQNTENDTEKDFTTFEQA